MDVHDKKSGDRDLLIVCGCTRSGMSLTMQMLEAGGYPVHGSFPAYEDMDCFIFPEARNCAIKIPDPNRWSLPLNRCLVIYCTRDTRVQAKSMRRFLAAVGVPTALVPHWRMLAKSISKDDGIALKRFREAGAPILEQYFSRLVFEPRNCAEKLQEFTGRALDVDAMASAAMLRGPELHPTLIETELLNRAR